MRHDCTHCTNRPEFEFASPTSYECIGFCDAFPGGIDILETEDQSDDHAYIYTYNGTPIVDCPCWEAAGDGVEKIEEEKPHCEHGTCAQKATAAPQRPVEELEALSRVKALLERYTGCPVHIQTF